MLVAITKYSWFLCGRYDSVILKFTPRHVSWFPQLWLFWSCFLGTWFHVAYSLLIEIHRIFPVSSTKSYLLKFFLRNSYLEVHIPSTLKVDFIISLCIKKNPKQFKYVTIDSDPLKLLIEANKIDPWESTLTSALK